jgi:hypothetical protein
VPKHIKPLNDLMSYRLTNRLNLFLVCPVVYVTTNQSVRWLEVDGELELARQAGTAEDFTDVKQRQVKGSTNML